MTQAERILQYLEENKTITQLEALSEFGIMRLASRISDLRKDGYRITRRMVTAKNRYNEKVSFAEYRLED